MKNTIIEDGLNKLGIHSIEQYTDCVKMWETFENRVFKNDQEKIDKLRDIVFEYYNAYKYNDMKGQYISVNPSRCHKKSIENYMCLFPRRTLVETHGLMSYMDLTPHQGESYDMPPDDFYNKYYQFEKLIRNDLAFLYPISNDGERSEFTENVFNVEIIRPLSNVAYVSQGGRFNTVLEDSEKFFLAFPWLYNANVDSYIDICDKYPIEFEHMAITIENLALSSNGEANFDESAFRLLKEAFVNLKIGFDIKKQELKRKGITAVLGIALTCVPFIVPDFFTSVNPALFQTIIGGKTLIDSFDVLNEFFQLKTEGVTDPFWVVWKWANRS